MSFSMQVTIFNYDSSQLYNNGSTVMFSGFPGTVAGSSNSGPFTIKGNIGDALNISNGGTVNCSYTFDYLGRLGAVPINGVYGACKIQSQEKAGVPCPQGSMCVIGTTN